MQIRLGVLFPHLTRLYLNDPTAWLPRRTTGATTKRRLSILERQYSKGGVLDNGRRHGFSFTKGELAIV